MNNLWKILEEKLPPSTITINKIDDPDADLGYFNTLNQTINESWLRYFDWYGVTCKIETKEEYALVNQYIENVAEKKIGKKIKIIYTRSLGNGHFASRYKFV